MTATNGKYKWLLIGIVVVSVVLLVATRLRYRRANMIGWELNASSGIEQISQCNIPGLQSIEQYRKYLHNTETTCNKMSSFGGKPPAPDAGRKMVCLDDRFNIQPGNCVVFSFGVGNEWSFEDDFDKFGCRVYAYDPTMGKKDHQRSKNVKFFAKGIANYKGTKNIGMGEKWSVKEDMLFNSPHVLARVKQIAMEVHDGPFKGDLSQTSRHQVFWPYFMLMRCAGFRLVHTRETWGWREVVWVRNY